MARVRRRRPPDAAPAPAVENCPPELLDAGAAVWADQRAYHQFMKQRRWLLPPSERMGVPTSPANRRSAAAAGWAVETGMGTTTYGDSSQSKPDWNCLRVWGLIT
jgi:hypothetical protein